MYDITSLIEKGGAGMSVEFKTKHKEIYINTVLWKRCSLWGYGLTILKPLSIYTGNKQISTWVEDMGARYPTVECEIMHKKEAG